MEKAAKLNVPVSLHEEDPSFIRNNGISHGKVSDALGIYGSPSIAEESLVARDCMLALKSGADVVIQHITPVSLSIWFVLIRKWVQNFTPKPHRIILH